MRRRTLFVLPLAFLAGSVHAQKDFVQELKLAVDRKSAPDARLRPGDERVIEEVLKKRLRILSPDGGSVTVTAPDQILVKATGGKSISDAQLRQFTRPGRLELRHLDDIRTSLNDDARYVVETIHVQNRSVMRFRDTRTGRAVPLEEFLKRCPVLASTDDIEPESARLVSGLFVGVRVEFKEKTARRLEAFSATPGRIVAVVLDGEVIALNGASRPVYRPVRGEQRPKETREERQARKQREKELEEARKREARGLDITGGYASEEEAAYLARVLNSGALPAPLMVVSKSLGAE